MLPIRDTIHSYRFPAVNLTLIAINAVVFFFQVSLPPEALDDLVIAFGVVPARLDLTDPLATLANPAAWVPLFTHMFLHGGWFHIISNMWTLFIFGDNVEDRMGSGRYLLFYLFGGLAAALAQVAINPASPIPAIGASGAIAGVLGSYFLLFPKSRVITLIPIFFIPWLIEVPAIVYLGFWFVSQLFSGIAALRIPHEVAIGGVAWWAHIGGFVFGMVFFRLFTPRRHSAYTRQYPDEYYPW